METEISKRNRLLLTPLLCAAMLNTIACTSTSPRLEQPLASIDTYDIDAPDHRLPGVQTGLVDSSRFSGPATGSDESRAHRPGNVPVKMQQGNSQADPKSQLRRCKTARFLHASLAIYSNPALAVTLGPALLKLGKRP